jgi:hypothetical protein
MQTKYLKYLFEKIGTLGKMEHDEIFKIIMDKTTYSKNKNGIFFNLSNLDPLVIDEIDKFVKYCISNKQDLDDYAKKINDCKINNNYNNIMGDQLEKEEINIKDNLLEDWNEILNESKSMQKINNFIEKIVCDKEKIGKKKANIKFNNAKKRYAKRVNILNSSLEDMPELEIESYIKI